MDFTDRKAAMTYLIDYIQSNISQDINTQQLERLSFVSHTQLYRDFYNMTGHSVKEYVRRRRLSNALALIKASELPRADISFMCGESSQQNLCRVVKTAVFITPQKNKKSEVHYYFPPYSGGSENQITVMTETIPPTQLLRYYSNRNRGIENSAVDYLLTIAPVFKGRIFGRNGKQKGSSYCYELYISDFEAIEEGLESSRFEIVNKQAELKSMFASTTVTNIEEKINASWNYLYKTWLTASMYECSGNSYFEEYLIKGREPTKLKLYLPIQKRSYFTKITIEKLPKMRFLIAHADGANAEMIASHTMKDYLSRNYTHILKSSTEFYIREERDAYICGVRLRDEIPKPQAENIQLVASDEGLYAILHTPGINDQQYSKELLTQWVRDIGLLPDENNTFAICDVKSGFHNPEFRVFCKIML